MRRTLCNTRDAMSTILEDLTSKALQLPAEEREVLLDRLVVADDALPAIDPATIAEAQQRAREIDAGQVQPLSHEELMQRLKTRIAGC